MSYNTGINQLVKTQEFFNNTTAEDQPLSQTNLSLIANLRYVQNWVTSAVTGYLPTNNPNFTGTLTSSSGGNISLTMPSSSLSVPTITSNTNFTGNPTIQVSGTKYGISVRQIGEIKMVLLQNAPSHYLLCNGQSISTTTYASLFSVIGYSYGGSGGSFNVPNLQSRFPIGGNSYSGAPASNFLTGNNTAGGVNTPFKYCNFAGSPFTDTPPLIEILPQHNHNVNDPSHNHATTLGYLAGDLEGIPVEDYVQPLAETGFYTSPATTGITILNTGTNITTENDTTSGLPGINISPPYLAVNFIIAYE